MRFPIFAKSGERVRTLRIRHTSTPRDMRPGGCRTPAVVGIGIRQTPEGKVNPPNDTTEKLHALETK